MADFPFVLTPTSMTVTFHEPVVSFNWAPPGNSQGTIKPNLRIVVVDGERIDVNNDDGSVG